MRIATPTPTARFGRFGATLLAPLLLLLPALLLMAGSVAARQDTAGVTTPPPGVILSDPEAFDATRPFDDPAMEAIVRQLASELRCPTCQALSIEDSPSELSQQMKGVIRDRLRDGMTPDEVKAHFVAAYGEWILLSPTASGFNLVVYILPFVALLAGFAVVIVGMRKWMQPRA